MSECGEDRDLPAGSPFTPKLYLQRYTFVIRVGKKNFQKFFDIFFDKFYHSKYKKTPNFEFQSCKKHVLT